MICCSNCEIFARIFRILYNRHLVVLQSNMIACPVVEAVRCCIETLGNCWRFVVVCGALGDGMQSLCG